MKDSLSEGTEGTKPLRETILVVDDQPEILFATSRILRRAGFTVIEGVTAAEGLSRTRENHPALVLLDVNLPDGDGVDVAREIKNDPSLASVFVVLCSGVRTSVQDQVDGLARGLADGYLVRPIQNDELLARIDAFLRIRDALERSRESDQLFRALFEGANDSIFLHEMFPDGQPGRYTQVNTRACERLMYTREELLQRTPFDIVSPGHRLSMPQIISRIRDQGYGTFEAVHMTKDGNEFPVEISTRVIEVQGKKTAISIARDISERKRFEQALQQANRQLKLLNSITRHDINNKILIISGYLEIIRKKSHDPDVSEMIQKIETATQAVHSQIAFTKVYQELGNQEPGWQNPDMLMPRQEVPASLTFDADLKDIEVFADPLLRKVFSNLLDNSVRHGKHVTKIRVSYELDAGELRICWEDNGVGVPDKDKKQIFEKGFGKNTGLGLFLSREILSLTKMAIRETGKPGIGARFEILVPFGTYRFIRKEYPLPSSDD